MSGLTRDGTGEPVSRNQLIRRERGQGKFREIFIFPEEAISPDQAISLSYHKKRRKPEPVGGWWLVPNLLNLLTIFVHVCMYVCMYGHHI